MTTGKTFLIEGGIVLPLEGDRVHFDPGSVLVIDGKIAAVGTVDDVAAHPAAEMVEIVDATNQVVMPGMHNCHLHSGLLRGTAESMALWEWLENHVDPMHRALTPEIAKAASYMAYTEGLRGGTTSVLDMWRFMEGSADAAEEVGIRATLAPYTADKYDYFESLASNRSLLETHLTAADGRVRSWVGLEHIFYCSDQMFRDAAALAEEFDTGIHTHSSESIWEVQECLRQFGRRPIEEFYNRGILGERTVIAHGVWLDDREVQLMVQTGTSMTHCPCSNMKLSSGPARIGFYREQGMTVALGTDGEKENNNLDMLEEMKFASLLQKVSTLDPTVGDPWDILDMATKAGAKALGLDDVTGTLEDGKDADIVMVDLSSLHFVPVLHGSDFNATAHLVFTASSHDVSNVWVQGSHLVEGGEVKSVDVYEIATNAQAAAEDLFARRAALQDGGSPVAVTT
ncbi:MAG: 5-methylthioadenosine/S-adenosylhomocysteine deaminase [Verrucomicrobiales bacterium]|jgi:5-methylthioadenosine/S-adenosylhomocysteine deaminase